MTPINQNIKQKQYCNKFNKDFKKGPHPKKKVLQKKTSNHTSQNIPHLESQRRFPPAPPQSRRTLVSAVPNSLMGLNSGLLTGLCASPPHSFSCRTLVLRRQMDRITHKCKAPYDPSRGPQAAAGPTQSWCPHVRCTPVLLTGHRPPRTGSFLPGGCPPPRGHSGGASSCPLSTWSMAPLYPLAPLCWVPIISI